MVVLLNNNAGRDSMLLLLFSLAFLVWLYFFGNFPMLAFL